MLEPFGVSVFNTVLSARPLATKASSSRSALKMLSRAKGSSFPQDFFTPRPRDTKGKERAVADEVLEVGFGAGGLHRCGDIPESPKGCKRPTRPSASSYPQRTRLTRRSSDMLAPDSCRIPGHTISVRCCDMTQRRHASTTPGSSRAPRVFVGNLEAPEKLVEQITKALDQPPTAELLESTWTAYEGLRSIGQYDRLSVREALLFGNRIVQIQVSHRRPVHEQRKFWQTWGSRLLHLLQDVDDRIVDSPYSLERNNWYRQRGSALALTGQIDEAEKIVSVIDDLPADFETGTYAVFTYNIVIRCITFYRNAEASVEFLIRHWRSVRTYLNTQTEIRFPERTKRCVGIFRWAAFDTAALVENPVTFLRRLREQSPEDYRVAGIFILEALSLKDLPFDALAVMQDLQLNNVVVPWPQRMAVIKALTKAQSYEVANKLFLTASQELTALKFERYDRELNELGLYLFARQGDLERVDEYALRLEKRGGLLGGQITLLIHAHAVRADPLKAIEVWERFFAPRARGTRKPDITHYTGIIHAYSRCGDHAGINTWLEKMVQAGINPDAHVYNVILQCFARRGEVASVGAILDQMRASKHPPMDITYTSVITMLARRKDPAAAEAIYKRAISDGVVPTSQMVNALMNAHVEAGSWSGVITAFNYLKSVARGRGVGITLSTYNTLLKAYILACAPFQTVFGFFTKMKEIGVKPDKYTYALVVQSACDAGNMDAARELFNEMEKKAADWTTRMRVDDYVLTIIMAGYLRLGLKARAKAVYDDMILRGIQPTSYTYRHILMSYSNPLSRPSLALAEQFLKSLIVSDDNSRVGVRSLRAGLEYLYRPILAAHRSRGSKEDVERLLQNLFDEGGTPTISNLSILMDLYRRRHNIEGVRQIWAQIHQLALQTSDVGILFQEDKSDTKRKRQANTLSIALSIYIDALSAAGQHTEVPLVWRRLATEGFKFDAHNWNHLVVALVRAGEVERAFEVVERVIIPNRVGVRAMSDPPDLPPASPLATDDPMEGGAGASAQRPTAALSHPDRRAATVAVFTEKAARSRPILNLDDFTHPLRALRQAAPLWNEWRPHGVVLVLLYKVMKHLEDGRRVHPVQGKAAEASADARTIEEREQSVRDLMPEAILGRVLENYPQTVRAVLAYHEFFITLRQERSAYTKYRRQVQKVWRLRTRGIIRRRERPVTQGGEQAASAEDSEAFGRAPPPHRGEESTVTGEQRKRHARGSN